MPESVTPLIAVGVVIVLFIVLPKPQRHQIQNRRRRSARNRTLGDHKGSQKDVCKRAV